MLVSCRERQAWLAAAGGHRLQPASDHHLHEADEAAEFGAPQGQSAGLVDTVAQWCRGKCWTTSSNLAPVVMVTSK